MTQLLLSRQSAQASMAHIARPGRSLLHTALGSSTTIQVMVRVDASGRSCGPGEVAQAKSSPQPSALDACNSQLHMPAAWPSRTTAP
jgi:hypothetical protein